MVVRDSRASSRATRCDLCTRERRRRHRRWRGRSRPTVDFAKPPRSRMHEHRDQRCTSREESATSTSISRARGQTRDRRTRRGRLEVLAPPGAARSKPRRAPSSGGIEHETCRFSISSGDAKKARRSLRACLLLDPTGAGPFAEPLPEGEQRRRRRRRRRRPARRSSPKCLPTNALSVPTRAPERRIDRHVSEFGPK